MDAAVDTPGACAVYRRRRPEHTPLYRTVQGHLETYLALAREGHTDGEGVPPHVEGEFRRYLECGILAHGFARARCGECGHDFLIAFSCKGRGVCPSCNARRLAEVAAHLVDERFPPLPVRQWVLSVPKRLRYFLQRDPEALSAVLHIVLRVIEARLRQRSRCVGGRLGAVSFVQRFGAALNAHVHFHCCVIDGVFAVGEDGQVHFAEAGVLTPQDLVAAQQQVRARVLAPNAPQRAQVIALARQPPPPMPNAAQPSHAPGRSPARYLWAVLLARIYEILPLLCPHCGAQVRIIAFLTEALTVKTILRHLGEPTTPPEVAPARGPPLWDQAAKPVADWADSPAPVPEFVFDQRLSW